MNPEQLRKQQRLENARRKAEVEAAEVKQKADEKERESREKVEEDRILRDIAEAEERARLQWLADERAWAEAAVKDVVESVAAAEEKRQELADVAGRAMAEAEEAKEKQRVLDDGEYKKLIREKEILMVLY